ncbi:heparin lyase I family protein [Paraburkholderia sp.]|uniref:heparin lyase I family protein n=1 Tax=Paraburkholderia sp. TaxID=1926495 RepID=UPI00239E0831|nr:heparin lyase I family protein [Paraburkholderia sp.]MDE1179735.1 heparin lyase I family protein [Paraburkholderia sp.]
MFAALLVTCICNAQAQDVSVQWKHDPGMVALAATYQSLYESDWTAGIDQRIGVQSNGAGIAIVDDPLNPQRKVIRATIDRSQDYSGVANGVPRAELLFPAPVRFAQQHDYLIRWSTFLPADFEFDNQQLTIMTQVHQGEWVGGPTIALAIQGSRYAISMHGGENHTDVSAGKWLCCADADRGHWVNWSLHYVPDDSAQHALTELYKDGVSIFANRDAANAYPDVQNAYLKIGLYKPDWMSKASDVSRSTVLFGPVRVSVR